MGVIHGATHPIPWSEGEFFIVHFVYLPLSNIFWTYNQNSTLFSLYFHYINNEYNTLVLSFRISEKGKPFERKGRKVAGLRLSFHNYDGWTA
jgi:hypothetical protein